MTATGLLRRTASLTGREAQSTAFFSWPGIDELYSGVANRIASACAMASRQCATASRGGLVVLVERREELQPVVFGELHLGR
jgi:hypothetical protein